jgi:hypothetical protein
MTRFIFGMLTATALISPALAQVSVAPSYVQAVPGQVVQFTAAGGPVVWQVNNAVGGTAASGTITQSGVFTAPATLPNPAAVTVTAVSSTNAAQTSTATITLLAQPPAGTTFYVATTGSDTNPGTQTAPFATLQHAADVAAAGDTVLVRQGVYNALLTPTHSGNLAQGPITFASYPGELATIDGTGLPIPGGQNGLITLNNISYFIVEGFELRNYTTAKKTQVPLGIYIEGAGSGVQIVNNHIHAITTTAKTTPKQCGSDAFGLAAYGTAAPASINGLVISGNEIDHLLTGCSETLSVDGNVDGYAVTSNIVHDDNNIGIANIGFEKLSPDPAYDQARNGEVRGNTVYNITSYGNPDYGKQYAADGIYIDGGTQIVIEQNTIYATDLAIEMTSEHFGHVGSYSIARNNLIYGNNSNGLSIGGYGKARGGSDHITMVNNTLFNNDTKMTGSGEFQIQWYATNNIFANNIVYAGPQALLIHNFTKSEPDPAAVNNNLYYAASGGANALFQWNGVHYKGFTKYQTGTGQDAQTSFADPLFQSLTLPNLDLQAGSPALLAGANLGPAIVGNVDFGGYPRVSSGGQVSIGAYQQ